VEIASEFGTFSAERLFGPAVEVMELPSGFHHVQIGFLQGLQKDFESSTEEAFRRPMEHVGASFHEAGALEEWLLQYAVDAVWYLCSVESLSGICKVGA
jgi:hypothetical protein